MVTGNKGSWSEFYTLVKLLADGKVYAADKDLKRKENLFYVILKILRSDKTNLEFLRDSFILIQNSQGERISEISIDEMIEFSNRIYEGITTSQRGERAFSIPNSDDIFSTLHLSNLSDNTQSKSDIRIVIHDPITQFEPLLGFSIKSYLGSNPTLFNSSKLTNIIYKIRGDISKSEFLKINELSTYTKRIQYLKNHKYEFNFHSYADERFKSNLELIDSRLPEILSYIVLYKYLDGESIMNDLVKKLNELNPCNFNTKENPYFYSYKIKRMLVDVALGLLPREVWTGVYDATGGYIVVKKDGDIVCFHIYNWNEFQEYLLNHTKIESPDSSPNRCNFGRLLTAEEINETQGTYIKLNFQIRFR